MTAWYDDAEFAVVLANAAAARMAPAAYVAAVSATAMKGTPTRQRGDDERAELLLNLLGVHRQMRGACTNLNQAVAKLNSLGEPVEELPAIAEYLRRVTTQVDALIAAIAAERS